MFEQTFAKYVLKKGCNDWINFPTNSQERNYLIKFATIKKAWKTD